MDDYKQPNPFSIPHCMLVPIANNGPTASYQDVQLYEVIPVQTRQKVMPDFIDRSPVQGNDGIPFNTYMVNTEEDPWCGKEPRQVLYPNMPPFN